MSRLTALFHHSYLLAATCSSARSRLYPTGPGPPGVPSPERTLSTEWKYQGATKAARGWTLEDTTALENAPTNAFIRGQPADASASGFASSRSAPGRFPRQRLSPCSLPTPELLRGDWKGPRELSCRRPFLWLGSRPGLPFAQPRLSVPRHTTRSAQPPAPCPGGPAAPTSSAGKRERCWWDWMSGFSAGGSRVTSRTGLDCNRRSFTVSTCWLAGQVTA